MAENTQNYGFKKLGPGESISDEGYKFSKEDRDLEDALLHALEIHTHDGLAAGSVSLAAPDLTVITTGGTIPAGARVFYKVALIDPRGLETAASPEAFVDTPSALDTPAASALELVTTGGILLPGMYYYVLTAYYPLNTQETPAGMVAFIPIPSGSTNKIVIHFPAPPTGAAGFNVYRQKPGQASYGYLVSIPTPGGATPADYTDNGSVAGDPTRRPPSVNATQTSNSVQVDLPSGAVPLADGWTWKIYRTYLSNDYKASFLYHVVEETFTGSGIITTTHTDIGGGTAQGRPLPTSQLRPRPPKLNLSNMASFTGRLPLGGVQAFPFVVTFAVVGPLVVVPGVDVWVCEFPAAHIVGARASLGVGSHPNAQAVIVDVNKASGDTPSSYTTVFTTQANRPSVAVGKQIGVLKVPDIQSLVAGDSLSIDIDQIGAGTHTDTDLTVNIVMLAQFTTTTSDWSWS